MISFEHHKVLIRWDGVFTPLKMEKLRPRELKFLVVHHWMSKEKTSDSSSGLLMLYPALFQQRHIELSLIQPPGGVVMAGGCKDATRETSKTELFETHTQARQNEKRGHEE